MSTAVAEFVLLGKVVKAHGIRGELKIRPFVESPENIRQYQRLYITLDEQPPQSSAIPWTNRHSRTSGKGVILQLAECTSREQAEALAGAAIWLPIADLPPLPEGEFYLHSLRGKTVCLVEAQGGEVLGKVQAIISSAGQDILVIRNDAEEFLVPAVRAFVTSIDETSLVLCLPPGLLDINRSASQQNRAE